MDKWNKSRNYRIERENPSFSSTLLDAIYRSIDEGNGHEGEEQLVRETMRKKHSCFILKDNLTFEDDKSIANHRRACVIEKWIEKKASEKVVVRRKTTVDLERKFANTNNSDLLFFNSSSSSSDSSCGGVFSSSDAESVIMNRPPKPIRTSVSIPLEKLYKQNKSCDPQQKPKHEGGFVKTKSRALKIYGDLKKVKQPISPGGRLSTFLNSLFKARNAKKAKISSETSSERISKSAQTLMCSSASSMSRSCLSNTPCSSRKLSNRNKSVQFSLREGEPNLEAVRTCRNSINEELKFHLNEKNRRVEEAARDLLKNYQGKGVHEFDLRNLQMKEYDDEDDVMSCESSDLFELDNLSSIGIERYREELPVYETTHLHTNRAIANGLIL